LAPRDNPFTSNDYFSAAISRQSDVDVLKSDDNSIIFAIYCAGVAIECMLRAYILLHSKEFDSKHNLKHLYIKSRLSELLDESEKEKVTELIATADKIWHNDLRYFSDKRYKRLKGHEIAKVKRPPKNIIKYIRNAESKIFIASKVITKIGEDKWIY
jgi:hypothetical protein